MLDAPSSTQSASDPTTKKKRVLSDETREKMRQAKLGKERSPETKAKIRQTLSGKGKSLAHIAASSEAHKQRFEGCPEGFEWLRLPKNIRDTPGKADRKNRWSPVVVPYFFEWEREFPEDPPHVVVKLEQDQYNLIRDLHECAALDIPADYNKVTERITVGIRRLPKPKPHTYSTPSPGDTDPRGYLTINGYFRLPEDTLDSIVLWHPLRVGDTLRQVACSKVTFFSPLFGRGWGPDASIKVDVYVYEE